MCNENIAETILDRLEGTIIADLNSLIFCAERLHKETEGGAEYGRLNFTLLLLSLIACETFGYYAEGAKLQENITKNKPVDTGQYIMKFMQTYFDSGSYFKRFSKVLADWLRNYLVHGFGSLDEHDKYAIGLFISENVSIQINVEKTDRKKVIKLNSIAAARQTISAFLKLKRKVKEGKDSRLINNILKAAAQKRPLSRKVLNEFNAVYRIASLKISTDMK